MLTTTATTSVSEFPVSLQNETLPNDIEISRRVMEIRAGWSLSERVRRRREAERRFVDLLDSLGVEAEIAAA